MTIFCDVWPFFPRETFLDPTAVFALLFGSELFEDYIGHLAVASMASAELSSEIDNPDKLHDKLKVFLSYPKYEMKIILCLIILW